MTVLQIFVDSYQIPRVFSRLTIPVSATASYMKSSGKNKKKVRVNIFLAPSPIQLIFTPFPHFFFLF